MGIFEEAKSRSPMRLVASRYTSLQGRKGKERTGPCPFCGGENRFYIYEDYAVCNPGNGHCGFKGDQIALVAKMEGVSELKAAELLVGDFSALTKSDPVVSNLEKKSSATKPPTWQDESWQKSAQNEIKAAECELPSSIGADYVVSRRLTLFTARKYRLGFNPAKYGRPAIVIPHINSNGEITAVKYRFIDQLAQSDKTKRFAAKAGSEQLLFGSHLVNPSPWQIIIVEGEFNALAISEAMSYSADVVSIGSQTNRSGLAFAQEICSRHPGVPVLTWLDEREEVAKVKSQFRGSVGFCSPYGLDANDVLISHGVLGLQKLITKLCPVKERRE
jgi:phage/plasmid primase-like uncharacterized protein